MNFSTKVLHSWWRVLVLVLHVVVSIGLNTDGSLLLSFKYSVLSDPLSVLGNWNYEDATPCSWNGVMCTSLPYPGASDALRVVALVLPNNKLLGSIPEDLGLIEHLRHVDLSNNLLNGSLPNSFFNASELKILALSNNVISGEFPKFFEGLKGLQLLNLSDNALTGKIPQNLSTLHDLTVLFLRNNYFYGEIPSGFDSLEVVDFSFNLINGSIPLAFGGESLQYLNFSYNRLSGEIPVEFAKRIPANAILDLSFNNLTGEVPDTFLSHKTEHFAGNPDLCGKPLKNLCSNTTVFPNLSNDSSSPSTTTIPTTSTNSPPAIAAIPKTIDSSPATDSPDSENATNGSPQQHQNGLKPAQIMAIVVGDLAGIGIFAMIFLYVYQSKKRKKTNEMSTLGIKDIKKDQQQMMNRVESTPSAIEPKGVTPWLCLRQKGVGDEESSESTSSETDSSVEEEVSLAHKKEQKTGTLVTVDGDSELELESLLKASAYILGASGCSIVYKAVLEDGTTFAVRRIGESGVERFKDFENQVRLIAKLRHPNVVRIRGFYWGSDEKLIIYDHVPNGSLANVSYKRPGSSPYHLSWETRLRIVRGVARGLAYLHDKKHVHGNLKPSNILLGPNMEPQIGDFGLEKLVWGDTSSKPGGSARNFGSKRSTASRDSFQDLPMGASPSPSAGSMVGPSPYHAPESLKNLKPNAKWDVYSFGLVLLELLTGKTYSDTELSHWTNGFVLEESNRVVRMVDVSIRAEVEGKEDILVNCFKLGFNCASIVQQKRPSMKEVVQVLEKIPSSSHYYDQ
ncbi:hypothetical protein AQUCO_00700772v1 [Aquilegia coerulea]|uniref:Protein kinase domain-containing protein n=1 Tax=Aquilegia coerulea TaxID=218851 RepID=A0A2G5ELP1_AQUCA|nr:hypothetical protein AQUCO_00700772v1 [Aquilegia coerulea]